MHAGSLRFVCARAPPAAAGAWPRASGRKDAGLLISAYTVTVLVTGLRSCFCVVGGKSKLEEQMCPPAPSH
eukprot:COSAG02_NODE_19_length_53976_cov_37.338512_43_plen_71_part_00